MKKSVEFTVPWISRALYRGIRYQDGSKLCGSHQLLVYADDTNILGGAYML